jgi:hypothetical protein
MQASVNPKAKTVEELQGRRKTLHMGMCKLLREDLVLQADLVDASASTDTSPDAIRRIKSESQRTSTPGREGMKQLTRPPSTRTRSTSG